MIFNIVLCSKQNLFVLQKARLQSGHALSTARDFKELQRSATITAGVQAT